MNQITWKTLHPEQARRQYEYKFGGWMWILLLFLALGVLGSIGALLNHSGMRPGRGFLGYDKMSLTLILFYGSQLVLASALLITAVFKWPVFVPLILFSTLVALVVLLLAVFSNVIVEMILTGIRCCGGSYNRVKDGNGILYQTLYSFASSAFATGYVWLAARPNLLYRHRIRQK